VYGVLWTGREKKAEGGGTEDGCPRDTRTTRKKRRALYQRLIDFRLKSTGETPVPRQAIPSVAWASHPLSGKNPEQFCLWYNLGKIRQGALGACNVTVGMNSPDPLNSLLASWRHEPAPASDFNTGVWARIRGGEAARPLAPIVRFPWALPLAASVAVLLSIAGGTGWALALNEAQSADRMASAYVRSIDPLQMVTQHHELPPFSS